MNGPNMWVYYLLARLFVVIFSTEQEARFGNNLDELKSGHRGAPGTKRLDLLDAAQRTKQSDTESNRRLKEWWVGSKRKWLNSFSVRGKSHFCTLFCCILSLWPIGIWSFDDGFPRGFFAL